MNRQHTQTLFEKYPRLYCGRKMSLQENLMPFGFECGDGWFNLIDRLSDEIEKECQRLLREEELKEKDLPIAVQVKEKFGTLRFYMSYSTAEIEQMICKAENESNNTCERCGAPGTLNTEGWWSVRCEKCRSTPFADL